MIQAHALSKRYWIFDRPMDRLWDWLAPSSLRRGRPFWALREIDFEVKPGTSMGIVGPNGAGKSTLLKILTGTTDPTEGRFAVEGRISSLLELGTGFHPEFTGRQNLRLGARMAGLTAEELESRFEGIVQFAEIGPFIDQPVRTYSSGMALRLGFALASSVDPDVLIIDEALSVGDLHFQQKCLRRIQEFHERGTTVLFVSHDPAMVKKFCDEAILLDQGRLLDRGRPDHVLDYYTALLAERFREGGTRSQIIRPNIPSGSSAASDSATPAASASGTDQPGKTLSPDAPPLDPTGHRTGNFDAVITSVYITSGAAHADLHALPVGADVEIRVRCVALVPIPQATVGINLRDRLGQEIFGVNTAYRDVPVKSLAPGDAVEVAFALRLDLGEGFYSMTVAIHSGLDHTETCYDWVDHALSFRVLPDPAERFTGMLRLPTEIHLRSAPASADELARARHTRDTATPRAPKP